MPIYWSIVSESMFLKNMFVKISEKWDVLLDGDYCIYGNIQKIFVCGRRKNKCGTQIYKLYNIN